MAYPKAALVQAFHASVTVELVLEVAPTGAVREVTVEAMRPAAAGLGFDTAALEAARGLRFEPALRDGTAIAARIRYRYLFVAPEPRVYGRVRDAEGEGGPMAEATVTLTLASGETRVLRPAPDGTWSASGLPPGKAKIEITAPGREAQTAEVVLAAGDDTQVLATLLAEQPRGEPAAGKAPGKEPETGPMEVTVHGQRLAPAVKSFTREEVRQLPGAFGDPFRAIEALPGVTPIISGLPFFYVRGAPPGNVGYFLDGIRVPYLYHVAIGPSVIHPGLVDRVDLYPGGYPARFGRFAGGIVSAETTPPRADTHGEANLRLFDAGALAETGFAGGRGTVLVGARYSYTAAMLSLLSPSLRLDYRDYQLRASYDVTPRDRITTFGFGAYDLLAEKQATGSRVLFGSEFYRLAVRHEHFYPKGSTLADITFGFDQSNFGEARNSVDKSVATRAELRHEVTHDALLRTGLDARVDGYQITGPEYQDAQNPGGQAFDQLFPSRTDFGVGVWTDGVLAVAPRVELIPGLRVDWYGAGTERAVGVDPRIAARFLLSERVRIVHAHGIAHQPPSFVVPIPGLQPANLQDGLQQSYQTSAGLEYDLDPATTATQTLFYNAFFDMTDAIGTAGGRGGGGGGGGPSLLVQRSMGRAFGYELLVKRRLSRKFGGFLSYTLSRSTRSLGRESFPSSFDRTHVGNVAVAYDLGRNWRAGTRLVVYTGTPKQAQSQGAVATLRSQSPERNPMFYRIDVRLEKRWTLGETTWISFIAEMMNVTLHKETFGDSQIGPIAMPSIGAELGF